jgi:hypothetical protein
LNCQRAKAFYYILPDRLGWLEDRRAKVIIEGAGSRAPLSTRTKIDLSEPVLYEEASDDVNTPINGCFSVLV